MSFDSRTYVPKLGWRIFFWSLSLIVGLASAYSVYYFGKDGHVGLALFMALMTLVATYLAALAERARIVLHADRFEYQSAILTRVVAKEHIAGWRIVPTENITALVIEHKDLSVGHLSIGLIYNTDAEFIAWFDGLANLDERDRAEAREEVLSDVSIGESEEARAEALKSAKKLARLVNIAGIVLSIWGVINPTPYEFSLALLLAAPWVAAVIAFRSRGLIRFDGHRNDIRPNIAVPLILPGAILSVRAVFDFDVLNWQVPVLAALVVAIGAGFIQSLLGHKHEWTTGLIIAFFAWFYAFGAVIELNGFHDAAPSRLEKYPVLDKSVSHAKRTTYYLHLAPSRSGAPDLDKVQVHRGVYQRIENGELACVRFHTGILAIEWYAVRVCNSSTN